LAAAGLSLRNRYLAPGILEQLDGRKADAWAEHIDQTGHEQADLRTRRFPHFDST
jgi:hypothetical protein